MVWRWSAVAAMAWTRGASRAQAKKHVDGNNIGPSHIISLGDHACGELWVADTFVEKENDKGEKVLRGGGGESVINCVEINHCVGCMQASRRWRGG